MPHLRHLSQDLCHFNPFMQLVFFLAKTTDVRLRLDFTTVMVVNFCCNPGDGFNPLLGGGRGAGLN